MGCRWLLLTGLVFGFSAPRAAAADTTPDPAQVEVFEKLVLPILSTHCFACHGPDAAKRKADLRLDTREGAVAAAVIPGKPEKSALMARITAGDADERMPPEKTGPRLKPEQIRILQNWIAQGAAYTEHWAFSRPKRPEIPTIKQAISIKNPIDAFVQVRLEKEGLRAAPEATREVLIRRATLDLTGLPPVPDEVEAFLKDASPNAYEKLIERLLASPHYGERWGRHWLDVARYADSGGFETDIFFGNAWRYRDYVIRSFNADTPFDRFVKEQIAGDELFPGNREAIVATALYAVGPVLQEADMVPGKLDYNWLTDAADTTGSAFLGLTVGCARCHDHKYDPLSQKDYFALQAVFAGSDLTDFKTDGTILRSHVALKKTEAEFEQARNKVAPKKQPGDYNEYPEVPLRGLGCRSKPLEVRLLRGGELSNPGDVVGPGLPAKFVTAPDGSPRRKSRTVLAEWVASKDNPLTARVIVNRVWQWHFGEGLVRTPNDFGVRGERPTHPELLDWLAVEFMEPWANPDREGGSVLHSVSSTPGSPKPWSIKHLHRLIVTSAAYRQSSRVTPELMAKDPDNRLLGRFQPRRVEAEVVWDNMRAAAGTLDRKMYGLQAFPPLDGRELIGNYKKWPADPPAAANRRAVYIVSRRSFRFPPLAAFDPPDNVSSCGRRDCTVVPNQALTLLNTRVTREQAVAFADRLLHETDRSPEAVAARAWLIAYGRKIDSDERDEAVAFLRAREKAAQVNGDPLKAAVTDLCVALFNTNEFIYLP